MVFEVVHHQTFISNDEEGYEVAKKLRNKLINNDIKFNETHSDNVILFKWTETTLTK